jgi:hypothetical protein
MLEFKTSYNINQLGTVISPAELKELYFYGIPIKERNGTEMSDNTILTYIRSAQAQIEGYLSVKLQKQIYTERLPFFQENWNNFNFLQVSFPARKAFSLEGWLAEIKQVAYPAQWLTTRETSDDISYHRRINLIPIGTGTGTVIAFSGIMPYIGMRAMGGYIPDYWKVVYSTGFDKIPADILTVLGKLASIMIFHQMGDIILGAGLSSMSLGVDGLSQSISTTKSAENAGYGARIKNYWEEFKTELPRLHDKYTGFVMTVL